MGGTGQKGAADGAAQLFRNVRFSFLGWMTKKNFWQGGWHFLRRTKIFFLKGRHFRSSPRTALVLGTPLSLTPVRRWPILRPVRLFTKCMLAQDSAAFAGVCRASQAHTAYDKGHSHFALMHPPTSTELTCYAPIVTIGIEYLGREAGSR